MLEVVINEVVVANKVRHETELRTSAASVTASLITLHPSVARLAIEILGTVLSTSRCLRPCYHVRSGLALCRIRRIIIGCVGPKAILIVSRCYVCG